MGGKDETPDSHKRVQWVYEATSRQDLQARYDRWAKDYDADLSDDFGYLAPQMAVAKTAPLLSDDPLVLDAGVGTGLVGEALKAAGVARIVGIDMSAGMLEAARAKGVYQELRQAVLGEPLPFADDAFDATLCIGTLTLGHAPAESLEELVRVTKPGGPVSFTLMTSIYESHGFKARQEALEAAGRWRLVEAARRQHILPKGEPELEHDLWIYQVLA
ncbi:MAG: class I SAM-dependent methyltransferase [Pseudomonadota bacterium]